ncbi:efflux RND transporter periplasmic adaptor subunit [Idiomarina xiamenensis]|uniref:HlyD family secretion protein n=1 Tax=Idiomarina xiamenensis 10-D-4 TaxID=740709 RepID=K2KCW4_9GAMM|nr:efflux RND transporter periplasmic adaptor subunit [Idiomarina xiamenensis]EKE84532.1 HlyD family secretion protein [Idiomarina xiamenensis 10-D-4]
MAKRALFTPVSFAVVALAVLTAYLFIMNEKQVTPERQQQVVPVRIQEAAISEYRDIIEALGTAQANESIVVTPQRQDVVERIYFEDGDYAEQGQLLVELNSREEQANVQELEFRLGEATRQLDRLQNLARENVASRQQLEEQDVLVKEITAQLEVARTKLAEMKIYAPFAGRLGIRRISIGSLVGPGDEITTLDDTTPIKVDFNIPELYFASLAVGQKVTARSSAYPGEQFEGIIQSIDSRVDPLTRSVLVRAQVKNEDGRLRPGMLLRISLLRSIDEAMILPEKAILPIQERQYVYVVTDDNRARQVEVTIGRRKPGMVEITSGLEAGEKVVVEGLVRLRDGVPVSVQGG